MEENVNHPRHYSWLKDAIGVEPVDICQYLNFCRGNAVKYILRAGLKRDGSLNETEKEIEDLEKAVFYLQYEINKLKEISNE